MRSKASRGLVILLVAPSPNFSGIVLAIFKDFKANQDQCELRGLRYVHLRTSSTLKNTDLERDFIYEGDVC